MSDSQAHGRGASSAIPSALGYFYQWKYALLEALRRRSGLGSLLIYIETLDDFVFDSEGAPTEVFQTKHHMNSSARLTNASVDLWKTLKNWIEKQNNDNNSSNDLFFMCTTAHCSEGSAASYLRYKERDETMAIKLLSETASSSTNETNISAYEVYKALTDSQRVKLVNSIYVLDDSPSIGDIDKELREEMCYAVEPSLINSYIKRLVGWWYEYVEKRLRDKSAKPISGEEIESRVRQISAQFEEESLPIDDDIMCATVKALDYNDRTFVKQLNLVGVNKKRVFHAIQNYYRAFEQRSRWVREDLILVGCFERYEEKLIEEWDLRFQQNRDDIGDNATEKKMTRAAQKTYKWIEIGTHPRILEKVTEPVISRGSYHMLADNLRVGWHPEFEERLRVPPDTGGTDT